MSNPGEIRDKAVATAVTGAGATVGGAGGATIGVLELAARGVATELSAGLVIGAGAVAGAALAYGVFRLFRSRTKREHQGTQPAADQSPDAPR
jgi:uncharacterized membrane protein YebE (DUF533 family)